MSLQVNIATLRGDKVVPATCPRCGQPYQYVFEQYLACNCQTHLLEANSQTTAHVRELPIHLRNLVIQLMLMARAGQEFIKYIPGAAGMVPH